MLKPKNESVKPRLQRAFTLIEMMTVMLIIMILLMIGLGSLKNTNGRDVGTAIAVAEEVFDEARATAVSRGLRSCVLIAKSLDKKPSEDLRRMVVAYEEANPDGSPKQTDSSAAPNWVLSSRSVLLPDSVFYSAVFSRIDHVAGTGNPEEIDSSRIVGVKSTYQGDYYIYEFNSQAICKNPGTSFMVGAGKRNMKVSSVKAPPLITATTGLNFGGFVIWRNGRTSLFRGLEQMGDAVKNAKKGDNF